MTASADGVVGREPELAAVAEFLDGGTTSAALLFTGGPGIGKTALWERALSLARTRGMHVLAARPSGTEAELSFAALFDLLEGIDIGAVDGLPAPQRHALEAALLRAETTGAPTEPFAVAAGFLSVLRSLAANAPLLVAVDDLPWLDAASAGVLGFAARRARGQRVRFLLASRSGSATRLESELGPARVHRIEVGPLGVVATRRLLSQCLRLTLPPRTFRRLFDAAQGNPLLALELGRALAAGRTWPIGSGAPVAELAGDPFGDRVAELPRPASRALLATALSGHLSLPRLVAVADAAAVAHLIAEGLLTAEGERVRVSHPLVASAARRRCGAGERQALHLALAKVAADQTLRARHLALSAETGDARVASTVAAAAAAAARRGAVHDAAELAEHALRLTPPSAAEYPGRLLMFAQRLTEVGELSRVTELLAPRVGDLPAGSVRARAYLLLGEAAGLAEHEDYLERALAESGDDPALRSGALARKSMLLAVVRVARIDEAEALAAQAHRLARSAGAQVQRQARLMLAWPRILAGHSVGELSRGGPGPAGHASLYDSSLDRPAAVRLAFRGHLGEARETFRRLLARADERGEARFSGVLMLHLCEVELRAGDIGEASRLLGEWAESGTTEGLESAHARCHALLAALRGDPDEVARWAAAALAPPGSDDPLDRWDELEVLRARGIAALAADEPEQAVSALARVQEHTRREGVADPGAFPVAADLAEALVRLGDVAGARAVASRLAGQARRQYHPWGLATARRCAALIDLSAGYSEAAAAALADAAARYGGLGLRFDEARSRLSLGRAARRFKKWGTARAALDQAAGLFAEMGAPGWAGLARAELARIPARRPRPAGELTPAERNVAELAASGLSNKQIARRLLVSAHTVEVHLSRAYRKLGIRSRTELASRLASAVR